MRKVDEVLSRMAAVLGARNDTELCEKLGVGRSTLSTWKSRDSIPYELVVDFAERESKSLDWLLLGRGPNPNQEHPAAETDDRIRNLAALATLEGYNEDEFALIPRLNTEVSAGHGSVVNDEDIRYMMAFRRDWLRQEVRVPVQNIRVITARGDSMNSGQGLASDIFDGDPLMVNTAVDRIEEDAVYVIQMDGHVMVKRVQMMLDGSVRIISANEAYAPQVVPAGSVESIRIAGKVVWNIAGRRVS